MNPFGINHFKQWFDQETEKLGINNEEKVVFRQTIIASRQKEFMQFRKSHAQMLQDNIKFNFDHEYNRIISVARKEIVKGYLQIIGFTVLIIFCLLFLWTPFSRKSRINVIFAIPESINSQANANDFSYSCLNQEFQSRKVLSMWFKIKELIFRGEIKKI